MAALGSATTRRLHATLAGTVVDTITLSAAAGGIELFNRGTADLWVSVNDVDPTVEGEHCDVVPGGSSIVLDADNDSENLVKLLGDGNAYSLKVQA